MKDLVIIALLILVSALGVACYMLPAIIAGMRKHHQFKSIVVLNLFLGWTVLGWVAALVWAFSAVISQQMIVQINNSQGGANHPNKQDFSQ